MEPKVWLQAPEGVTHCSTEKGSYRVGSDGLVEIPASEIGPLVARHGFVHVEGPERKARRTERLAKES